MFLMIREFDNEVVEKLPQVINELLIFSPAVPLRRTLQGFQAINEAEWKNFVLFKINLIFYQINTTIGT